MEKEGAYCKNKLTLWSSNRRAGGNTGIDVVGEQKCYCESGVARLTAESEIFEV